MPQMPRTSKKATKIAYAILGKPANMKRRSAKEKKVDNTLFRIDAWRMK
jgi:hypothetical protein